MPARWGQKLTKGYFTPPIYPFRNEYGPSHKPVLMIVALKGRMAFAIQGTGKISPLPHGPISFACRSFLLTSLPYPSFL